MSGPRNAVVGTLTRAVRGLRFPQLFLLTVVLFVIDLLIPDLIPFIDEILLGLAGLLLASWKRKPDSTDGHDSASGARGDGPVIDVKPED
jgi:hypothetical protein